MRRCQACLKVLEIRAPVGRQECCPFCGSDLHCCLNCSFHARGAYNECREPQAERVLEKGRGNFCDFFVFRDAGTGGSEKDSRESAKARMESLFRKG